MLVVVVADAVGEKARNVRTMSALGERKRRGEGEEDLQKKTFLLFPASFSWWRRRLCLIFSFLVFLFFFVAGFAKMTCVLVRTTTKLGSVAKLIKSLCVLPNQCELTMQ